MMKKYLTVTFAGLVLIGCMGGTQTVRMIEHYTLEYAAPRFENLSRIPVAVRVEPFSAVSEFSGDAMVYRPKPYVRDIYNYQRWNVRPADMVSVCILRDMREAGIFSSVLSYEDEGDARFVLEGRVEEFMEIDEDAKSLASLTVYVKLTNSAAKTGDKRIILEKSYPVMEPFKKERQPDELARAMSAAMEKLSRELITDIYRIARTSI